jgi:hypothetical protein
MSKDVKQKMPDVPKYTTREIDGDIHYVFPYYDKETQQLKEFPPIPLNTVK